MTRTALQWAKRNLYRGHPLLAWIEQQDPNMTMSEAYRRCPSVAWLWKMLIHCTAPYNSNLTEARRRQISDAMNAFTKEFWPFYTCNVDEQLFAFITSVDSFLSDDALSRWADRLRTYITPV